MNKVLNNLNVSKIIVIFIMMLPNWALAQFTISGKVLNQPDKKGMENVNVFLKNTTIGAKTSGDGTFTLDYVKPGKYELVVSVVGFETYTRDVTVNDRNINLQDIEIKAKATMLKEVVIKPKTDLQRQRYFELFKDEFLGKTNLSNDCKILNPEVLNLDYDETTQTLTASSYDFLLIENSSLGYRVKYLLSDFVLNSKDEAAIKVYFEGSVLFEELNGTASQQRTWERNREEVYEGSMMHFLRAALSNRITSEGFRVLQIANHQNPERPPGSVIAAKIKKFKDLRPENTRWKDSVSFWSQKAKLPKMLQRIMNFPLEKQDILNKTDKQGIYAFGCDYDNLYITYNKNHHHHPVNTNLYYLNSTLNTDATLINFNTPWTYFDNNGSVLNPNSLTFSGIWVRYRVAGLLPINYKPKQEELNTNEDAADLKINEYPKSRPVEKAYLQFDKPYYATGDTMYFKAYVTMGERHEPSKISGVLHVDLIGTDNKANNSIKLQLVNGIGWGDFALADSLPQGNYRIRAYTRWMRNAGDDSYFEKTIPIGSLHQNKIPESNTARVKPVLSKVDLQFFPEGGELISGISTKIAFKAIGTNGMGIDAKGTVTDNTGKDVASFASNHLGMGYFNLKPEESKSYKASITFADGTKEELPLPTIGNKGISLTINNDSIANAAVRIEANPNYFSENKGRALNVLIYSGGVATTVSCKLDSSVITMDILKRKLFTGITTVTLFSQNNEPIAERLIFVQNYDQLDLDISTDKNTYNTREKVNLKLNAKTRADSASLGHFSVAITDESKVQQDENNETTILTDLLLTSDLKGTIEQPNYYFADIGNQSNYGKQKELDLVMLTHGYRHFTLKRVLSGDSTAVAYEPETSLTINGTAKNLLGIPLKKATVTLLSAQIKSFVSQTTDDKGRFSFDNLVFTDSAKFILQAVNSKGNNATQLTYEKYKSAPLTIHPLLRQDNNVSAGITAYLKNDEKQQEELNRMGIGRGRLLSEVKIRGIRENNNYPSSNLGGAGHADQVWHRSDIHGGGRLVDQLNGVLRGVTFFASSSGSVPYLTLSLMSGAKNAAPMLIVLDGAILNSSGEPLGIGDINLSSVETVEVLSGANASIYGMNGGGGVLVITTRQGTGLEAKDIQSVGILPVTVQGFYRAREFYSPKYDTSMPVNHPDLRSTIYWAPEVVTGRDGNASIDFYNADGKGTYKVVIEGIDENGNIGRQVYRYKVE